MKTIKYAVFIILSTCVLLMVLSTEKPKSTIETTKSEIAKRNEYLKSI
ncbi:MAG: hypothetical protein GY820_38215 [Gammaproteobacteria bacterium]|nr:hypothetical protein [Gammaproteobacteria bacterium]